MIHQNLKTDDKPMVVIAINEIHLHFIEKKKHNYIYLSLILCLGQK